MLYLWKCIIYYFVSLIKFMKILIQNADNIFENIENHLYTKLFE